MFSSIDLSNLQKVSTALETINPKLAFGLVSLAQKNRPSPLIGELYRDIKRNSGIFNLVLIGNCQITPLAKLLHSKSLKVYVSHFITVHLYQHTESIYRVLDDADYIISQNLSNNFHGINTQLLEERYPKKLIKILNLYYRGFHPDWCSIPKVNGLRLKGPMGDYHNETIIDSFIEGVSEEEAYRRYSSVSYNEKYSNIASKYILQDLVYL